MARRNVYVNMRERLSVTVDLNTRTVVLNIDHRSGNASVRLKEGDFIFKRTSVWVVIDGNRFISPLTSTQSKALASLLGPRTSVVDILETHNDGTLSIPGWE